MFYIHQTSCISPLPTFADSDISKLHELTGNHLKAIEPVYHGIAPAVLRRMGKSVRMGVGTALSIINESTGIDGIIIGTGNGGKEDCVKFLTQIVDYNEGLLTPINFVQSTPNAAAAQIGLLTGNHGYNITHVHLGLAFELAMIDADMLLLEHPSNSYLLGAVDDIATYNFIFEEKSGGYKPVSVSNNSLYQHDTAGSIAGEGSAMFLVNRTGAGAVAKIIAIDTLHHEDEMLVKEKLQSFIKQHLPANEKIDIFITGENGDNRLLKYYAACESVLQENITVGRFKHMSGEFPTASAIGLWISCNILQQQLIPAHMVKKNPANSPYRNIVLYNNYKGLQHSYMLISLPA